MSDVKQGELVVRIPICIIGDKAYNMLPFIEHAKPLIDYLSSLRIGSGSPTVTMVIQNDCSGDEL